MSISIRRADIYDARTIASLHVHGWKEIYKNSIPNEYLEDLQENDYIQYWQQYINEYLYLPEPFVDVAVNASGNVVGFINGGIGQTQNSAYKGEIYMMYVSDIYQRQGIGTKLFQQAVKRFEKVEIDTMIAWTCETNPNKDFYEAMGGDAVVFRSVEIIDKQLEQLGYGWEEL